MSQVEVRCEFCGRTVPEGEFCGACGAHLRSNPDEAARRRHAFAANPGEAMVHLSVVSTLFPHLPHRRLAHFRVALLAAAGLLVLVGLSGLTGPAIALEAAAVPAIYLLYLYEVEVYEDQPLLVIGATFLLGGVLGAAWGLLAGPLIPHAALLAAAQPGSTNRAVPLSLVLPVLAQALMLVGPLVVFTRRRFREAMDGFAFGAASALGFTFAATFVELLPDLQQGLFSSLPVLNGTLEVVQRGLLVPVVNASTTGLVAATLWLRDRRRLATAALVAVLAQACLGLAGTLSNPLPVLVAYAVVAAVLLLWVRVEIHHMLLAEAAQVERGPLTACSHCHRVVPRMAFCSNCGVAFRATPKTGRLGAA